MQKTGESFPKGKFVSFNALNMTFLYLFLRFSTVVLIRFVRVFGSVVKDGGSRLNSLKTALVFSYFAA